MAEPVQGLWIGRPLSGIERLSIASFLRNGHEYRLYCYDRVGNVPDGVVIKDGNEILPASDIFTYQHGAGRGSVAAFSNLFRYKLLLDRGGWWVDTDVVCLRPFDFSGPAILASEDAEREPKPATAVMKLPAGSPIAARCYEVAHAVDRGNVQWGEIGPELLTRVVTEDGLRHLVMDPAVFCPVPWWDWHGIVAADPRAVLPLITDRTCAIHLWHEMWRREGLDGARAFPPTSLFGQLMAKYGVTP